MREKLISDISDVIGQSFPVLRLRETDVVDEFGPKLYENFEQVCSAHDAQVNTQARILPSATVPQTGRTPGMFTRKSQNADSSVLSHPMLWLDERIFGELPRRVALPKADLTGWSRSASVGQSVWNGAKSPSEPSTGPSSPVESDNEEYEADVDYDDVSGYAILTRLRY